MMKSLTYIHVYLIQTILNILPFFWIDVFYDNQTYIGNQLNHPIYLFLWALSSAINDNLNMYINDHLRMYTSDYALI